MTFHTGAVRGWLEKTGNSISCELEGAHLESGLGHPLDDGPPHVLWINHGELERSYNWVAYTLDQDGYYHFGQDATGTVWLRRRVGEKPEESWIVVDPDQ